MSLENQQLETASGSQNADPNACPRCGVHLDEENLVHDGYMGSSHAHGGRGSYGLGRHHYYQKCECGWSERPDKDAEKRRRNRRQNGSGSQTMNGLILPKNAASENDCRTLSCNSRLTLTEKIAEALSSGYGHPDRGSVCGHSLCSSYTYPVVTLACFRQAEALAKTGAFRGLRWSWDIAAKITELSAPL
jgi:hypothetical protein